MVWTDEKAAASEMDQLTVDDGELTDDWAMRKARELYQGAVGSVFESGGTPDEATEAISSALRDARREGAADERLRFYEMLLSRCRRSFIGAVSEAWLHAHKHALLRGDDLGNAGG